MDIEIKQEISSYEYTEIFLKKYYSCHIFWVSNYKRGGKIKDNIFVTFLQYDFDLRLQAPTYLDIYYFIV